MKELTIDELKMVNGSGDVTTGVVGTVLGGIGGAAAGRIAGTAFGLSWGGPVGFAVGILIGVGFTLATSGGGSTRRPKDFGRG